MCIPNFHAPLDERMSDGLRIDLQLFANGHERFARPVEGHSILDLGLAHNAVSTFDSGRIKYR